MQDSLMDDASGVGQRRRDRQQREQAERGDEKPEAGHPPGRTPVPRRAQGGPGSTGTQTT